MPTPDTPGTVNGVMTPTETGCLMNNYAQDVMDVLEQLDHEYMPVVDSFTRREPLGVVTRTDLRRLLRTGRPGFVSDVLIAGVPTLPAGLPLDRLTERLAETPVALVVDPSGALVGYLEVAAVLPYLARAGGTGAEGTDA